MISVEGVTKEINGRVVVDELNLRIKKGTVFGFLGPNGAGKTTTIKMLVGLNTPSSGTVMIDGKAPGVASAREQIGFMPEAPYFYEHLTGLEFLTFCSELFTAHRASREEVDELLHKVGIFEARNNKITTYSKGMKQRLGFAQALVNDPDYIFLDEPLDGLDPIGRRALKIIIGELKRAGKTIFFNSHILFDTEELCDEIGVLHQGSLLFSGPIAEFTRGKSLEEQFVAAIESLTETSADVPDAH